ncbi:MAG: DoxX family protein [Chitinophagales bacterium]|nr:DoxX family protein [Chitinophagales bacterium]
MKSTNVLKNILSIICAAILLQTLRFKFTAAPESVYIFSQLGVEPWGRILSGVIELIAGILLLIPATRWYGAFISLSVISGAILSHLFILGINVQGDGGKLFALAMAVFVISLCILWLERNKIETLFRKILK